MFGLVALVPHRRVERHLPELYLFEEEAVEAAEFWLVVNPDDIVMLVEVQTEICDNCEEPIQEKPGWILHKWIHIKSQHYHCLYPHMSRAEPKERE